MTAVPKPGDGTVTFKMDEGLDGKGKTGPLSCESSFTVEVTLVRGCDKDNDWSATHVALVASDIPLAKIWDVFFSLYQREDPNIPAYGVNPYNPEYLV